MNEIVDNLYTLSLELTDNWQKEKAAHKRKFPPMREITLRQQDGTGLDHPTSPHLMHINQCLNIIEEVEMAYVGTKE
jgi:hypothetical protein